MRIIGASIIFVLSVLAFRWSAGEIAVQTIGKETRATVTSVSKGGTRRPSYTANYEFVTTDKSKGYGHCPSRKGATGGSVRIRYLQHNPSFNTPPTWWYAGFFMLLFGAPAWLLALWSSRILLFKKVRRFGEAEDEDEDDDEEETQGGGGAKLEKRSKKKADAGPVPFRNRWSASMLLSLVFSVAAIAVQYSWFQKQENDFMAVHSDGGNGQQPTNALEEPTSSVVLPRGASAGNMANDSFIGFDGANFYAGIWRDHDNPSAPAPGLYRFNLDGSGREPVGKPGQTESIYRGIQVRDGWVYYISMNGICRIRTDGTKFKQLTDSRARSMAVVGDWIYFQHSALNNAIWRMKADGGGEKALTSEGTGVISVADDGTIYYTNKLDGDTLWRMNADGSGRARCSDFKPGALVAAKGYIWFTDTGRSGALCRMGTDGGGLVTLTEDPVNGINVGDDRVYFMFQRGGLARCKFDGTEKEAVAREASAVLLNGGHLYILPDFESNVIIRCRTDGSEASTFRPGA